MNVFIIFNKVRVCIPRHEWCWCWGKETSKGTLRDAYWNPFSSVIGSISEHAWETLCPFAKAITLIFCFKIKVKSLYLSSVVLSALRLVSIRPCHSAAILSRETKKALFYLAKPRSGNHGGEAWRGKTKLFWSPGTIWPPCDKGEWKPTVCPLPPFPLSVLR